MDTAIFRVSKFTVNTFIYCCLIFNTIKWTCLIKSLIKIGTGCHIRVTDRNLHHQVQSAVPARQALAGGGTKHFKIHHRLQLFPCIPS